MDGHTGKQVNIKPPIVGNINSGLGTAIPLSQINPLKKTSFSAKELISIANRFHKEGDLSHAETIFRRILEFIPEHPIALHFLGVIAIESDNIKAAVKLISKSTELAPDYYQAFNNLGNALDADGKIEEAEEVYQKALDIKPGYLEAMFNLGIMKRKLRKFREAELIFEEYIKIDPTNASTHFELGFSCERQGNRTKAQMCYGVALNIDPKHSLARIGLAGLYQTVGRLKESIEQYDISLQGDENLTKAINSKGIALRKSGRFEEAVECLMKSYELNPEDTETLNAIASAYQSIGDINKATQYYTEALKVNPLSDASHKCVLFVILNNDKLSTKELFDIHREVRGPFDKPEFFNKDFLKRDKSLKRKIKLGYISSDFRTHVVAMNVLPLLANHNHDQFEIFLYGQVEFPDEITQLCKGYADHWCSTMQKTDREVADIIEKDEIDILVVLAGRFDENRPIVTTYRPAPIQVSFHDCATSGLKSMDYYFTDSVLHPSNTAELFTEELYRLPYYYQYPVQEGIPEIKDTPALNNDYITFGSFNKPEKIGDSVIDLWANVLLAVPNSKLLLKYFNHYDEESMKQRWISRFEKYNIVASRIIFMGNIDDRQSHLALYDLIDIALDPFPFNGATTTFESLSMGVPVVSLLGKHFVDRVAGSIVTHAGYPELAVKTKSEYIECARKLASNYKGLNNMRRTMRNKVFDSKLCDGIPYAENIEKAYRDMWSTWVQTGGYKGK